METERKWTHGKGEMGEEMIGVEREGKPWSGCIDKDLFSIKIEYSIEREKELNKCED